MAVLFLCRVCERSCFRRRTSAVALSHCHSHEVVTIRWHVSPFAIYCHVRLSDDVYHDFDSKLDDGPLSFTRHTCNLEGIVLPLGPAHEDYQGTYALCGIQEKERPIAAVVAVAARDGVVLDGVVFSRDRVDACVPRFSDCFSS